MWINEWCSLLMHCVKKFIWCVVWTTLYDGDDDDHQRSYKYLPRCQWIIRRKKQKHNRSIVFVFRLTEIWTRLQLWWLAQQQHWYKQIPIQQFSALWMVVVVIIIVVFVINGFVVVASNILLLLLFVLCVKHLKYTHTKYSGKFLNHTSSI